MYGLDIATREKSKKPVKYFQSIADLKKAYASGEVDVNDEVEILEGMSKEEK